ncbi:MAG: hypothetical protein ACHQQQ_03190 [Bacteroidota bacterium]
MHNQINKKGKFTTYIDVRRLPARTTKAGRLLPTPAKKTAGKAVGIAMTYHMRGAVQ